MEDGADDWDTLGSVEGRVGGWDDGPTLGGRTVGVDDGATLGGSTVGVDGIVVGITGGDEPFFDEEDEVGGGEEVGKISLRLRRVANLLRPLYVGSPASREGQRVDGGCFKRVTRSVAVCFQKTDNLTSGKGME